MVHSFLTSFNTKTVDDNTVLHLASQALLLIAELAGPVLVVSLAVGLFVALFQAVTSIQEFTLTFLPKVVGDRHRPA